MCTSIDDSLYNTCTDHGIEQICSILYAPNNAVHLHFMDVDKQTIIIQTVACMPLRMPLIYAVMKMCVLGNMTQY